MSKDIKKPASGSIPLPIYLGGLVLFIAATYLFLSGGAAKQPVGDQMLELLDKIYTPISASASDKVMYFLVDANDQSGAVKQENGTVVFNLNIPGFKDPKLISDFKSLFSKYISPKDKKERDKAPDDAVIKGYLETEEGQVQDPTPIVEGNQSSSQDGGIIQPISFTFTKTGYYKIDFSGKLKRMEFKESEKILIVTGEKTQEISLKDTKKDIKDITSMVEKWNKFSGKIYICVFDATKPVDQGQKLQVGVKFSTKKDSTNIK